MIQKDINKILAKEKNPLKRKIRNVAIRILRPFIQAYDDRQNQLYAELIKQVTDIQADIQNEKSIQENALQNLKSKVVQVNENNNSMNQQMKTILNSQIDGINNSLKSIQQMNLSLVSQIDGLRDGLEKDGQNIDDIVGRLDKARDDMGAIARQVMLAKWKIIDHLKTEEEQPDDLLTCKICGETHKRKEYETKETDCIFNGGHLVRYVCPECGAIFGPSKFIDQGQKGIDEDYWVHYLGFSEGNLLAKEERAFFMLKPEKGKIYLNYGCGRWSHSLQKLRDQGYNVYGYEPYAPEMKNPYLIIDKEQLSRMRFDGIYSNDVLEHLIDPVEELKFMGSILLSPGGKMSHCTSCYIYKYEFTRFHTYFFTGNAVYHLAERSGMEITDVCDDMEKNDFICYVYRPKSRANLIEKMFVKENAVISQGKAWIDNNGLIYGPYLTLLPHDYIVGIDMLGDIDDIRLMITADMGKICLMERKIYSGINRIEFSIKETYKNIEFVINNQGVKACLEAIWLEGINRKG